MADFSFRSGYPIMVDHTPGAGNVAAGSGVLLGNLTGLTIGVSHLDLENTKLGELAVGGGVYECLIADNYAVGSLVYKPEGNAILSTTSTNSAQFGFVVKSATAANTAGLVLHHPYVPT